MVDFAPVPAVGADGFPKSDWTPPDTGVQLAPGGAAAAAAGGYAPPPVAPAPVPAPQSASVPAPPAPAGQRPKARLAPRAGLEERVAFDFPVEFDGRVYEGVTVRRLSIGDLAAFMERREGAAPSGAVFRYPIYFDDAGEPMPDEVLDAVEIRDHGRVVKATNRFLPSDLGGDPA